MTNSLPPSGARDRSASPSARREALCAEPFCGHYESRHTVATNGDAICWLCDDEGHYFHARGFRDGVREIWGWFWASDGNREGSIFKQGFLVGLMFCIPFIALAVIR